MFTLEMAAALALLGPAAAPGLSWSAPPECPGSAEVQARIDVLLGRPKADIELAIDGLIERSSAGAWALDLTLGPPEEATRHHLVAVRCATLADAAALLVAVHVDPVATARTLDWSRAGADDPDNADDAALAGPVAIAGPRGDGGPPVEDSAPPGVDSVDSADSADSADLIGSGGGAAREDRPSVTADPADADTLDVPPHAAQTSTGRPRTGSTRPWSYGFGLAGGVELGALPGPAGLVQAAIVADRRRLRLALTGSFMTPRERALPAVMGGSVRVLQGTAGLRTCARLAHGRLVAPLCLGLEVGALEGTGDGIIEARTERSFWLATLFAPSLGWSLHPSVEFIVGAEIALPLVRPQFILAADDPEEDVVAHSAARVSGRILGGLVFKLQRPR